MDLNTHLGARSDLVGRVLDVGPGTATAALAATASMAVDDRGLVHGGFAFGLADFAAMCAVNDPNVVLGGAETRFVAPVRVGDEMRAVAQVTDTDRRKRIVSVTVEVADRPVLTGTFTCFVLDQHVLDA